MVSGLGLPFVVFRAGFWGFGFGVLGFQRFALGIASAI